jgi:hypothetical protein
VHTQGATEAVRYNGWTCRSVHKVCSCIILLSPLPLTHGLCHAFSSLLPNSHNPSAPALLTVKYAKPREGRDGEDEKDADGKPVEKLTRKRERPPTPEPPRYNRRVASDVSDDLKAGSVNFGLALRALRHWLRTGEVSLCKSELRQTVQLLPFFLGQVHESKNFHAYSA